MFIVIVVILFLISFLMALRSLQKELEKPREVSKLQRELIRGKALYLTKQT